MRLIITFLFLAPWRLAMAQSLSIGGPETGLVYDQAGRSIRPIFGMAGSATLGPALYSGLSFASIAPNGKAILAVQGGDVIFIRVAGGNVTTGSLPGAINDPDRAVWAADSSHAILASSSSLRVQRVNSTDTTPVAEEPMGLAKFGRELLFLAADAQAQKIAVGLRSESAHGLYLISGTNDINLLAPMRNPSAAVFSEDGLDLYAADRAAQQILVFRNAAEGASSLVAFDERNQIADPVALAVVKNQLIEVEGTGRGVAIFDLSSSQQVRRIELEVEPTGFEHVAQSPYFQLNGLLRPHDELWLVDPAAGTRAFFVPGGEQSQ